MSETLKTTLTEIFQISLEKGLYFNTYPQLNSFTVSNRDNDFRIECYYDGILKDHKSVVLTPLDQVLNKIIEYKSN